jgi:hypothetical protein
MSGVIQSSDGAGAVSVVPAQTAGAVINRIAVFSFIVVIWFCGFWCREDLKRDSCHDDLV